MVCLCKVLCVGDWKLFLLRLVIYLVLLFCFVLFFKWAFFRFHLLISMSEWITLTLKVLKYACPFQPWQPLLGSQVVSLQRWIESRLRGVTRATLTTDGAAQATGSRAARLLFVVRSCCLQRPAQRPGQMEQQRGPGLGVWCQFQPAGSQRNSFTGVASPGLMVAPEGQHNHRTGWTAAAHQSCCVSAFESVKPSHSYWVTEGPPQGCTQSQKQRTVLTFTYTQTGSRWAQSPVGSHI